MTADKTLEIFASQIEMHYDELDTNAINFQFVNGYLSIQIQIYIDPDNSPEENEPYFEMQDDSTGQYINIKRVYLDKNLISIKLSEAFCLKYYNISIYLPYELNFNLIDFFVNHLFLGKYVEYSDSIPNSLRIKQTQFRDFL